MVLENSVFPTKNEVIEFNQDLDSKIDLVYDSYSLRYNESLENYEGEAIADLPSRVQAELNTIIAYAASTLQERGQLEDFETISAQLDGMGIV
ncbi:MAG: hypothetical protein R6V35_04390 [Candidatus Nanohaloarchaea archaeon]